MVPNHQASSMTDLKRSPAHAHHLTARSVEVSEGLREYEFTNGCAVNWFHIKTGFFIPLFTLVYKEDFHFQVQFGESEVLTP